MKNNNVWGNSIPNEATCVKFLTACIQTTLNLFPGKSVGGKLWGFRNQKLDVKKCCIPKNKMQQSFATK